jgi:hypothetical protein
VLIVGAGDDQCPGAGFSDDCPGVGLLSRRREVRRRLAGEVVGSRVDEAVGLVEVLEILRVLDHVVVREACHSASKALHSLAGAGRQPSHRERQAPVGPQSGGVLQAVVKGIPDIPPEFRPEDLRRRQQGLVVLVLLLLSDGHEAAERVEPRRGPRVWPPRRVVVLFPFRSFPRPEGVFFS